MQHPCWGHSVTPALQSDLSPGQLTALTTPDPAADYLQIYDTSAALWKKILPETLAKYHSDGTAALPAIAFESDLTKGIYSAGSNLLGLAIAGVGALILSATALYPLSNDAIALGIANTNAYSDVYLASGAVVNFAGSFSVLYYT